MNGWLLDTNVVAELASPRAARRVLAWAAAQDEAALYLSILTLAEYDKGLNNLPAESRVRARVAASVAALELRFRGRILGLSDPIVRRWGTISGAVKRRTAQTPPLIDTMLAATAIEHDLCLVTRNVRDVRYSGARVLNPWKRDPEPGASSASHR